MNSPATRAPTMISEPGGAKRNAFSKRLSRICSSIVTSSHTAGRSSATSSRTRCARAIECAGADAAQLECVPNQSFEPFCFVSDRLDQLASLFGFDARPRRQQRRRRGLDRGQRRTQIVTHRRQEPRSLLADLGYETCLAHFVL